MSILLGCLALPLMAQVTPLEGFYYGSMNAPTGWEWQSVDSLAYNKNSHMRGSSRLKMWNRHVRSCRSIVLTGNLWTANGLSIGHPIRMNVRRISMKHLTM